MTVTHRKRQYQPEEIQSMSFPASNVVVQSNLSVLTRSLT